MKNFFQILMKEWNILLKYHENMNNNENIEFVFLIYPLSLYYINTQNIIKRRKIDDNTMNRGFPGIQRISKRKQDYRTFDIDL